MWRKKVGQRESKKKYFVFHFFGSMEALAYDHQIKENLLKMIHPKMLMKNFDHSAPMLRYIKMFIA